MLTIKEMADATCLSLIASGGVTTLDQIEELLALESRGVGGIIIGRALYEGSIDLRDALKLAEEK